MFAKRALTSLKSNTLGDQKHALITDSQVYTFILWTNYIRDPR